MVRFKNIIVLGDSLRGWNSSYGSRLIMNSHWLFSRAKRSGFCWAGGKKSDPLSLGNNSAWEEWRQRELQPPISQDGRWSWLAISRQKSQWVRRKVDEQGVEREWAAKDQWVAPIPHHGSLCAGLAASGGAWHLRGPPRVRKILLKTFSYSGMSHGFHSPSPPEGKALLQSPFLVFTARVLSICHSQVCGNGKRTQMQDSRIYYNGWMK